MARDTYGWSWRTVTDKSRTLGDIGGAIGEGRVPESSVEGRHLPLPVRWR